MRRTILSIALLISCSSFSQVMITNVLTLRTLPLSENSISQSLGEKVYFQVQVSDLDFLESVLQGMNADTKRQYQAVSRLALRQQMKSVLDKNKAQIKLSGEGIALATALQIKKLPAVVFERRYIIYGTTDVLAAYQAYQAWQQRQGVVL